MKYSVIPYENDTIGNFLCSQNPSNNYIFQQKLHLIYFKEYFNKLDAKTVVIENEYIDKDFLEDFSFYYVRCFHPYKRFCSRLHFFKNQFSQEDFQLLLNGVNTNLTETIQKDENYIGFIVIKPLPKTVIGRSCLRTYPSEEKRFFPFVHRYPVNLFGIGLSVNSIAYQEQDSVVAACASSAIWSAFQATGYLFQHSIPSPVEITKAATKYFPYSNRHFPNPGLTPEQMAHAIRNVGLEPFLVNATVNDFVKISTYAYLKAKIPLVLGVKLVEFEDGTDNKVKDLGYHAVAITGFSMSEYIGYYNGENFLLSSSKIDKLYVHDDQVGPFARMVFDSDNNFLTTSWPDSNNKIGNVRAYPQIIIIPLYHKIRITVDLILNIGYQLDEVIKTVSSGANIDLPDIEWDIFLSNIADFKSEILSNVELEDKAEILTANLPRYIWRIIGKIETDINIEKIEFLFDATDIEQGELFVKYIPHSIPLTNLFKEIAFNCDIDSITSLHLRKIFDELRKG